MDVLFVMAVGSVVAYCWISRIGKKRWIESVLDSR